MIGLCLSCYSKKTECLYHSQSSFYNFLKYKSLICSKYIITLLARTVKNIKNIKAGNSETVQGSLEISTELNSTCSKLCRVKISSTLNHRKCALLKKPQKSFNANTVSSFVFILTIKQKSGIPCLPLHLQTFPASFNKKSPKQWFTALMYIHSGSENLTNTVKIAMLHVVWIAKRYT